MKRAFKVKYKAFFKKGLSVAKNGLRRESAPLRKISLFNIKCPLSLLNFSPLVLLKNYKTVKASSYFLMIKIRVGQLESL